ncbi:MAG: ADP-ribosylation/crystallin J1 [Sphingobacteriales bacterium]|nr:MAG: ADP-ribosylation/crystallin J1 [Sphingobacteriales bacterium]
MPKPPAVTTLYHTVSESGLQALQTLRWRGLPPCAEAAFYPALTRQFALETTRLWKLPEWGTGYLTRFKISARYVRDFEVQSLSGEVYEELWVPTEELGAFNQHIVGKIEVLQVLHGS